MQGREKFGAVDVNPGGETIAAGGADGSVKLFDLTSGNLETQLDGHTQGVPDVDFSPNGRSVVSASADGTARIWNVNDGSGGKVLTGHVGPVLTAQYAPDGRQLVTAGEDGTARIWSLGLSVPIPLELDGERAAGLSISSEPVRVAVASQDATVKLFALENEGGDSGEGVETVPEAWSSKARGHGSGMDGFPPASSISLSEDGTTAVVGGNAGLLDVFDATSGSLRNRTFSGYDPVVSVDSTDDGKQVLSLSINTEGAGPKLLLSDGESGKRLRGFAIPGDFTVATDAVLSPDEQMAAVAVGRLAEGTGEVRIFPIDGASEATTIKAFDTGTANAVAYSPDGRRLAVGGDDGTVKMVNVETGEQALVLRGHRGPVLDVNFSPDGGLILTAGRDGTARLWSASGGTLLQKLPRGEGGLQSAVFSPDGRLIGTAGEEALVAPCGAPCLGDDELLPLADELAGRLSDDELAEYLGT